MSDPAKAVRYAIGGFRILDARTSDLIALLEQRRADGRATELHFANANFVVGCHSLVDALHAPEALIVNDGIGLDLASWIFHRRFFTENLNGTDFTQRLLAALNRPTRIFLLGARPASVRAAAEVWSKLPNVNIVGVLDGYQGMRDDAGVLDNLHRAGPDILLVALGNPRQEQWIVAHRGRHDVVLVIGVGALFDFVSGRVSRAPRFMRRMRMEWMYRLLQEPRRLAKRYSIDLVTFFVHCARTNRTERLEAGADARRAIRE